MLIEFLPQAHNIFPFEIVSLQQAKCSFKYSLMFLDDQNHISTIHLKIALSKDIAHNCYCRLYADDDVVVVVCLNHMAYRVLLICHIVNNLKMKYEYLMLYCMCCALCEKNRQNIDKYNNEFSLGNRSH